MNAVAVRGEMAIAVGLINYSANDVNGMIWRMSGDDDWARSCSRHICGGEGRQEIHAVAQISASRLIAVGRDAGEGDFDAAVWLSDDDGETWERVAKTDTDLGGAGNQVLKDVAVITGDSGNRLLAVGGNRVHGAVWMSNDNGDDWKRVFETRANAELLAVAQQGARVIAVGREGGTLSRAAAWISDAPASQWTQATVQEAQFVGQQMVDVVLGPDELVAVGNATRSPSEAAIWGSTDGIDWAAVSSDSFGAPSGMTGVTMLAGGPLFAVGVSSQNGRIWVSSPQ